jgi:hypothetical protein
VVTIAEDQTSLPTPSPRLPAARGGPERLADRQPKDKQITLVEWLDFAINRGPSL